jgi:hypothetical protein
MLRAAKHGQAWPLGAPHDEAAHMMAAPQLPPMFRLLQVHDYRTLEWDD